MTTNKTIEQGSELGQAAVELLAAASAYWDTYARTLGPSAVVWLEADSGHFILFTRSEYKTAILEVAHRDFMGEPVMFEPFTMKESHAN